jgi:hypothetical protein
MGCNGLVQRFGNPEISSLDPLKNLLWLRLISMKQKKGPFRDAVVVCPAHVPLRENLSPRSP